jgi:hypothetical protein
MAYDGATDLYVCNRRIHAGKKQKPRLIAGYRALTGLRYKGGIVDLPQKSDAQSELRSCSLRFMLSRPRTRIYILPRIAKARDARLSDGLIPILTSDKSAAITSESPYTRGDLHRSLNSKQPTMRPGTAMYGVFVPSSNQSGCFWKICTLSSATNMQIMVVRIT